MKIITIIQARMSSSRLPGKVLIEIAGKPMLHYVYKRASTASVDKVLVATSTDPSDDTIYSFCQKQRLPVFRGNLTDVLDRFYQAANHEKADIVIRVTSDCPLIDGALISHGVDKFLKVKADYLSNTLKRTFPRGFDFEVFTFRSLETAWKNANENPEREHVTPYIYRSFPEKFRISSLAQPKNTSHFRLTVDTPEDLEVIKIMIENYHADKKNYQEITDILISHPEIAAINKHIMQKQYGH